MVVCDSGPLIHLSRLGKLGLLRDLFKQVEIPPSVYQEVVREAKALGKPGVSAIEDAIEDGWIKVVKVKERAAVKKLAESENVQIGDAEVIYLAKAHSTSLVANDGWLLKVARSLGVQTVWTTTLVLLAVKREITSKEGGKDLLRDLVLSGLYIRPNVYAMLLQSIEEL